MFDLLDNLFDALDKFFDELGDILEEIKVEFTDNEHIDDKSKWKNGLWCGGGCNGDGSYGMLCHS